MINEITRKSLQEIIDENKKNMQSDIQSDIQDILQDTQNNNGLKKQKETLSERELKLAEQLIKTKTEELESWKNWVKAGNKLMPSDNLRMYRGLLFNYIGEIMTDEEIELYKKYRKNDKNDIFYYFTD